MHQAHAHLLDPSLPRHRFDHLPRDTNLFPCAIAVHLHACKKPTFVQSESCILNPKVGRTRNFSKRALNYYMGRCAAIRI